jgi:hypothetical protein
VPVPTYRGHVAALVWLAIPLVAVLAAMGWAAWAGRQRRPGDPLASVEEHHRFVQALERTRHAPLPGDLPPEPR